MSFRCSFRVLAFPRTMLSKLIYGNSIKFHNLSQTNNFSTLGVRRPFDLVNPISCQCVLSRYYAKGKDKKKTDSKGKKKVHVNEGELSQIIEVGALKAQMQKVVDTMKDEYIKNVSLRSSSGSIEGLKVKLDGQEHTLQELAQIVRKNPKTIVVNMSTFPQAIPNVLQAIQKSGLNLNPQQDGTTLFIPVPVVTRDHRENLARNAKALYVKCRDGVRDVQNKYVRNIKKQDDISEDLSYSIQQQIITIGDQYIEQADKMLQTKHAELLGKD